MRWLLAAWARSALVRHEVLVETSGVAEGGVRESPDGDVDEYGADDYGDGAYDYREHGDYEGYGDGGDGYGGGPRRAPAPEPEPLVNDPTLSEHPGWKYHVETVDKPLQAKIAKLQKQHKELAKLIDPEVMVILSVLVLFAVAAERWTATKDPHRHSKVSRQGSAASWARLSSEETHLLLVREGQLGYEPGAPKPEEPVAPKSCLPDAIWPDDFQGVTDNIAAGVVAGVKFVLGMVAFATLLYGQTPELEEAMPMGVKANILSCIVLQLVYSCCGTLPFGMCLVQDIPCMVLGKMGTRLPDLVAPEKVVPTFALLVSVQALLIGLTFLVASGTGVTRVVNQLPQSLLSGFLLANGLGLWRAAGQRLTNVPWTYLWPDLTATGLKGCVGLSCLSDPWTMGHIALGLLNFAIIGFAAPALKRRLLAGNPSKVTRFLAGMTGPLSMCCLVPVFYGLVYWDGCLNSMRPHNRGWLNSEEPGAFDMRFWRFWINAYAFEQKDLRVLPEFAGDFATVCVIALVEACMGTSSIEAACPRDEVVDLGKEVKVQGMGNLLVGSLGGTAGYMQTGMTINANRTDCATHRLAGFTAAAFCTVVFVTGAPLSSYVPRFVPAAIFLLVGYVMVKDSAYDTLGTMPLFEYLGILVCGAVFLVRGMDAAICWSFLYSTFLFLVQSSQQSVVAGVETQGPMRVVALRGTLFFGSVQQVLDVLLPLLEDAKMIVLDLSLVQRLDGSACKAFKRLVLLGQRNQTGFCFVASQGVEAGRARANLERMGLVASSASAGGDCACRYFEHKEEAVAFCAATEVAATRT